MSRLGTCNFLWEIKAATLKSLSHLGIEYALIAMFSLSLHKDIKLLIALVVKGIFVGFAFQYSTIGLKNAPKPIDLVKKYNQYSNSVLKIDLSSHCIIKQDQLIIKDMSSKYERMIF